MNQAKLVRAVADNMKQRLFTTGSDRAKASVVATRQVMYIMCKILLVKWLFLIHTTGYMKISIWRRRSKKFMHDPSSQQPRNSFWFY